MKKYLLPFLAVLFLLPSCEDPTEEKAEGYRSLENMIIPDYNASVEGGCEKAFESGIILKAGDNIWKDLGSMIMETVGENLISFGTETGINKALEYFFGDDKEKMNIVVGQFEQINEQMKTLLSLSEETLKLLDEARYNSLKTAFEEYNAELFAAANVNNEFIERIGEDITDKELEKLIREWGNTPVNGNAAKLELNILLSRLFRFSYMYSGKQRNLFSVYDMIVFQNTPWERTGYDIRESFRAYVAAILAQTFYLTSIYYHYWDGGAAESQSELKKSADMAIEFCGSHGNKVQRREDAVCQLKGARLVIKNYASTDGNWCILYNGSYPFPSGQITKEELDTIVSFYKNKGVSDDFTIIDCLNDGGLKISKAAVNGQKPKIVLSTTGFTYSRFFPGFSSTDCTVSFSGYVDNVPVNSYKGSTSNISFENTPVHDYAIFDMTGNFMVAPDGITRYKDFN